MFKAIFDKDVLVERAKSVKREIQDLWEHRYKLNGMSCVVPRYKLVNGCWYIVPCHPVLRTGDKEIWADFAESMMKII